MQVRAITVNAAGMAAEQGIQRNRHPVQPVNNMSDISCRVTISQEGRKRSRQQAAQTEKSAQGHRLESRLFRRQEEAEQNDKVKEGYREELKNIERTIDALNTSYTKKKDITETIEKEQEVLRAMRNQKQAQMEENQRRAKEAQQMAMQSAEYQEEIDRNNRDLLTLLRSMEEAEKAEEDRENRGRGEAKGDGDRSGASGTKKSAGDVIQNSAVQFMVSSVKREWGVQDMLAGLSDEGHRLLDMADTLTRNVLRECETIRKALDDEAFSDDERAEMMKSLQGRIGAIYKDVEDARGWGLQILEDAQECKIMHIADNPLSGMKETKRSMMQSAVDVVYNEAVQGRLGEASEELQDEVERLIDERNGVDRIPDKLREDKEEDEEERNGDTFYSI